MNIKALRQQRGWSQEQLASMSGLSTRTIQRVENSEDASSETLKSLAAVFEIPLYELRQAEEPDNAEKPLLTRDDRVVLRQIRAIKAFYSHLTIYVAVMLLLLIINLITSPSTLWFIWPAFGWGIGLFFHGMGAFRKYPRFGREWERREYDKRIAKRNRG